MRSVILGAVLAVLVVVATVTFSSGLSTLNSHPALYGWNWNDAIATGAGGSVPPVATRLLDHDHDVAAWTGFNFGDVQIDGLTVPELDGDTHTALTLPLLSGHSINKTNQVVLGEATLAALHKKVGDTVVLSYGGPQNAPVYVPPTPVVIVGTATFPAVGTSGTFHPSMATGVLFASDSVVQRSRPRSPHPIPTWTAQPLSSYGSGPGWRRRPGWPRYNLFDAANKVLNADPNSTGASTSFTGVQRPAEIVSYQSTGATPALLGVSCRWGGAVAALGLTLVSSVRRRRRTWPSQDPRIHSATVGNDGGVAGVCVGDDRRGNRRTTRHRAREMALDPLGRRPSTPSPNRRYPEPRSPSSLSAPSSRPTSWRHYRGGAQPEPQRRWY